MNTLFNLLPVKKLLFFCLMFSGMFYVNGQEERSKDSIQPKHEIRLDIFQLIVLPGIDLAYEHFIDDVSSWGVSAFFNFDRSYYEGYRFESFEISPYYRLYFRANKAPNSGFFVQPFLSVTEGVYDLYSENYDNYDEANFFGLAGGALIGRKWVNRKNYSFEIHLGVGRFFVFEKGSAYQEGTAYPRINFAIGKRF